MKNKLVLFIKRCLLLCLAITTPAWAIFYPPQIVPAQPNSNQFIHFTIRHQQCDTFATSGPNDRELIIINNRILVTAVGVSAFDPFCFFPERTSTFNIGFLPPGSFTLEVYRRQAGNLPVVNLVQTANFAVTAAIETPVPSMKNFSLILLTLGFLLAGIGSIRHFLYK